MYQFNVAFNCIIVKNVSDFVVSISIQQFFNISSVTSLSSGVSLNR